MKFKTFFDSWFFELVSYPLNERDEIYFEKLFLATFSKNSYSWNLTLKKSLWTNSHLLKGWYRMTCCLLFDSYVHIFGELTFPFFRRIVVQTLFYHDQRKGQKPSLILQTFYVAAVMQQNQHIFASNKTSIRCIIWSLENEYFFIKKRWFLSDHMICSRNISNQ